MAYDFEHAAVCPNKEEHQASFRRERDRAKHAEKMLWEALQPVTCPNCQSHDAMFFEDCSMADPMRLIVWGCRGCRATFGDFPTKEAYAESIG